MRALSSSTSLKVVLLALIRTPITKPPGIHTFPAPSTPPHLHISKPLHSSAVRPERNSSPTHPTNDIVSPHK